MITSIVVLYTGRWFFKLNVRPFELKAARACVPVVFFYNANVGFALAGLKALNIPIFNTLKRMTPVMVLSAKFLLGDPLPSRPILLSVVMIVSGCIIAGTGDMSFNLMGYLMALMSCFLQTTYLLLVERSGKEKGLNSNELLLYNAVLSLPVLLVLIVVTGESKLSLQAIVSLSEKHREFLPLLLVALIMGSLLNYTLFLCTLCNSALTTTIVGALKAVVSTTLGFFLLGGVVATRQVVIGIVMNTLGGVGYTMAKYQKQKKRHGRNDVSLVLSSLAYGKKDGYGKLSHTKDMVFQMPIITPNGHVSFQALQRKSSHHTAAVHKSANDPEQFTHVLVDIRVPNDPPVLNVT
ncbi:hypothetical protein CBR_g4355 [Chara braunii]|uniref:Sugar phosphate transporter domain-containing protein n=1 Tax=Chara braunii TaxID=69332 RepID=A0A388KHJ9_CHABU|nr:hypothetical protein CBR_g4355 [Chara braunii]|eukprot:GBG69519.1 hypothetical protein CBR_g4355 [Chara braunii]